MTIQQLEARTGLPRGSIRYYEKEGLISPRRRANGYRDYSEEDALTLDRVALLRRLELPLDTIRALQSGELPLHLALARQEAVLISRHEETCQALALSRILREEGVSYETLQPTAYQAKLSSLPMQNELPAPQAPAHAAAGHPVRRLLARVLDESLFGLPGWVVPVLTTGLEPWLRLLLMALAINACCILLEALCLSQLGTTPGKALMGLHLRYAYWERTGRPGFGQALLRAVQVWALGRGLGIGPLAFVCGALAWRRADRGEEQPWDDAWQYTADERARPAAAVLLLAGILAVSAVEEGLTDRLSHPVQEAQTASFTAEQLIEEVNLILSDHPQMESWREISLSSRGVWVCGGRELSDRQLTIQQQEGAVVFVKLTGPNDEAAAALANALYLALRELLKPGMGFQSTPFAVEEGTGQFSSNFGSWSFSFLREEGYAVAVLRPMG